MSIAAVLVLLVIGVVYFLPWLMGSSRGVNNSGVLFLFNLLLGWTVLGWIVALLWAVAGQTKAADRFYRQSP